MQLLHAFYTLQKEHEPSEWNKIWFDACGLPFGETFPAPVCTRWEHIGMASIKFVEKMKKIEKVALGITNAEELLRSGVRLLQICAACFKNLLC